MAEENATRPPGWVDFALAKSVPFERVSEALGIAETLKRSGNEYRGVCPFHGGTKESFGYNIERGFKCHGCQKKGGNVLDFVNLKLFGGSDLKGAARWLVALLEPPVAEKPTAADSAERVQSAVVMTARDRAICRGVARYLASVFGALGNVEMIEQELSRFVSEAIGAVDREV
jgi:hypothetical protein